MGRMQVPKEQGARTDKVTRTEYAEALKEEYPGMFGE